MPTSMPEMPEPCMAMPIPTARTLPLPMSRAGYLSSQPIISVDFFQAAIQRAALVFTAP